MKRPVFWAVVVLALGEVIGLARHLVTVKSDIGFILLVIFGLCVAAKYCKKRYLLLFFFLLGYVRMEYALEAERKLEGITEEFENNRIELCLEGVLVDIDNNGHGYLQVMQGDGLPIGTKVILYGEELVGDIGDYILVSGTGVPLSQGSNPGEFNAKQYYGLQGVCLGVQVKKQMVLVPKVTKAIQRFLYERKIKLKARIEDVATGDVAALYQGLLLGDKTKIDDSLLHLFRRAGISHILSISALHISLIGYTLWRILRRFGVGFCLASMLSSFAVLGYGCMTGFRISTIRAIVMLIIALVGEIIGRQADILTSLSIVSGVILLGNPLRLMDGGFWLGITAILGIFLGQEFLRYIIKRPRLNRWRRKHRYLFLVLTAIITTIFVHMSTLPVICRLYYSIPVYSPFINLIVVPLMTPIMVFGFFAMLLSYICLPLSVFFFRVGGFLLRIILWICRINIKLPMHRICTGSLSIWEIGIYYGSFFGMYILFRNKCHLLFYRGLVALAVCIVLVTGHQVLRKEQVVFLDVGQGDGTIIRGPSGHVYVVDGGSTTKKKLGEYVLEPALGYYGMQQVDIWFISHFDEDHISGLQDILEVYPYSEIEISCIAYSGLYEDKDIPLLSMAKEQGIDIIPMWEGNAIQTKQEMITCFLPVFNQEYSDDNAASLCLLYETDKQQVLFTGDVGAEEFEKLCNDYSAKKIKSKYSIVKIPHHGSRYSLVEDAYTLFDEAVVSCGRWNRFGHPHQEIIDALTVHNIPLKRTDQEGCISY